MTEQSYGIIPFYRGERGLEVFLIHMYGSGGDTLWTFPKGRGEEGETPMQTALRECKEETGIVPDTVDESKPFSSSYSFVRSGILVEKTSTYFIGFVSRKDFIVQPEEVKEAGWFTPEEARVQLTFPDYKILLDRALENLDNSQ
jgi:8-oxo-dGTP pyrophosphatase MutT (NUDIX family)